MQKVTISDVAREAGCSKAAVSYVINRTRPISPEVRKKVLEAAERLGYHPSGKRNSPRRQSIALLIRGDFPVGNEPAFSFHHEILRRGYVPQIFLCDADPEALKTVLAAIGNDRNIAGVINAVPDVGSLNLLKYCREVPSFIYARNGCMLCSVHCNYIHRMRLALTHLHALGHRRIVFFIDVATTDRPLMIDNLAFLKEFCQSAGMAARIVEHPERRDNALLFPKLDREWENGCTAVLAWNDFFASMIYQWAYEREIRIPDMFSVLAFSEAFSAQGFAPPLTSVQIPTEQLVRYTVDALLARIEDRKTEEVLLHPFLSPGSSTGPALKKY